MLTGSMFLHHLRMFFTEVFSTASVVIGLAGIVTNTPVAGALAMSIGVINSPAMIVPLTLIVLKMAWDDRKFWYFLMPIASLVGICVEAWVRRGSPFLTGYEGDRGYETQLPYSGLPGFSYPFILGVLSILFSFGKGLFFFVPGLVLCPKTIERTSVRGPLRRLQELLLLFVAGMILVYAKWWAWYGGWYWGPRFFLLACVPASLALAIHLRDFGDRLAKKVFVLSQLILSVWVAIDGAIFGQDGLEKIGVANNFALESFVWYVPEFSPLWYPLIQHRRLGLQDLIVIAYVIAVTAWVATPMIRGLAERLSVRIGTWAMRRHS